MKKDETIKNNKNAKISNIPSKIKKNSNNKNTPVMPEEFEEDRSMDIRMKLQPLKDSGKKDNSKKKK